jgi:hypothetical protein
MRRLQTGSVTALARVRACIAGDSKRKPGTIIASASVGARIARRKTQSSKRSTDQGNVGDAFVGLPIHDMNDYHACHECLCITRLVARTFAERLRAMPALVVTGARQTGESNLVQQLTRDMRRSCPLVGLNVLDAMRRIHPSTSNPLCSTRFKSFNEGPLGFF